MLPALKHHAIATVVCLLLGACASGPGPVALAETGPGAEAAPSGYQLSQEELALDCKQLTGRMQVRILQIRDYESTPKTTLVSRALQTVTASVLGGTTAGTAPDTRYARDRATLEAYNKQLAAKGCNSFDLEAELKARAITETPTAGVRSSAAALAPAP